MNKQEFIKVYVSLTADKEIWETAEERKNLSSALLAAYQWGMKTDYESIKRNVDKVSG